MLPQRGGEEGRFMNRFVSLCLWAMVASAGSGCGDDEPSTGTVSVVVAGLIDGDVVTIVADRDTPFFNDDGRYRAAFNSVGNGKHEDSQARPGGYEINCGMPLNSANTYTITEDAEQWRNMGIGEEAAFSCTYVIQ